MKIINTILIFIILIFLTNSMNIYAQATQSTKCEAPAEIIILIPQSQASNIAYKQCRENYIKNAWIQGANSVYAQAGIKLVIKSIKFKIIPDSGPGYKYEHGIDIPYDPSNCLTANQGITVHNYDFDKNDFLDPIEFFPTFNGQRIYIADYVKIKKENGIHTLAFTTAFTIPLQRKKPHKLFVNEVLPLKRLASNTEFTAIPAHEGIHFGFYREGKGHVDDHKFNPDGTLLPPNNIMNSGSISMTNQQKQILRKNKCATPSGSGPITTPQPIPPSTSSPTPTPAPTSGSGPLSGYCGDGIVGNNFVVQEQCDPPGNTNQCPGNQQCSTNCQCPGVPPSICGNGNPELGEECGEPGLPLCPAGKICFNCHCYPITGGEGIITSPRTRMI